MREHGTYVKYVADRCRCEECRKAKREYEKSRRYRKAVGGYNPGSDEWPWVDAEKAKDHLRYLATQGIGRKQVAKISGVPHGSLSKLMYGDRARNMPPSARIHRDTERAILAVKAADGSPETSIPAGPTWRRIDDLVRFGVPKARIARAIGQRGPGLQLSRSRVKKRSADAVEKLHDGLMAHPDFRRSVLGGAA